MTVGLFEGKISYNQSWERWNYYRYTAHGYTTSHHRYKKDAEGVALRDIEKGLVNLVTVYTKLGWPKHKLGSWSVKSDQPVVSVQDESFRQLIRSQIQEQMITLDETLKKNKKLVEHNETLKERADLWEKIAEMYFDKAQKYDKIMEVVA